MNKEFIQLKFSYKNLLAENEALKKRNSELYYKVKDYNHHFDDKVEKRVREETIAYKNELSEKNKIIEALEKKIAKMESEKNNNSTNSGLPTSKTKIGEKKFIPNSRVKSGKKVGGQTGHKKHKLHAFNDDEITEVKEMIPNECSKCHSTNIEVLDSSIDKDETDYVVKVIKRRYKFINCHCKDCNNNFHMPIPNDLKEENQYGKTVQSLAVCLNNEIYTPFNKVVKLVKGITNDEINLSEGYVAKLQKKASSKLDSFIGEMKNHIQTSPFYGWDDGVIFVDTKQAILRTYCTDEISLFIAHEKKDEDSLDEDGILLNTDENTVVMHDHVLHNYNDKYRFENVECLCHLIRRLKKSKENTKHKWQDDLITFLSEINKERNVLISQGKESFSVDRLEYINNKYDEIIDNGISENKTDKNNYFINEELSFIKDLKKYKKNYLLWVYRLNISSTNNNSERNIRPVKSKLKISGQFKSIETAKYYANIRSYIETCKRMGKNIIEACERLMNDNPYTLEELLESKKQ